MGRLLRRQEPGSYYFITHRCHQRRFFLQPGEDVNESCLEWLARAQQRFPGVRLHAVCIMSNHLHMVVRDEEGELSDWACYLFGNLAKSVNRIRDRSGTFYDRRHSATVILDPESLLDRVVYTIANPAAADLCEHYGDWPGLTLFARDEPEEIDVSWIDRAALRKSRSRSTRKNGTPEVPRVQAKLVIDPIPSADGAGSPDVAGAIEARERDLAGQRLAEQRSVLPRSKRMSQHWHDAPQDAPRDANRSPAPICHAADPALRRAYKRSYDAFVSLFSEASKLLREGVRGVSFPEWSFPPGRPLVRELAPVP